MSNIEKFRLVFGGLIIILIIYDNYINQSASIIPHYVLVFIAVLYALVFFFAKLKK